MIESADHRSARAQNGFLCVHGHFYQPPRENPWLEAVERQPSAYPFHNWNERITNECYGPNTAARISTWDRKILDIRNNFIKISFNFGPTLLGWLETERPDVYEDIIEADRVSARLRGGHGNALAQAYNHTILPLGTDREKRIQVVWGLEDFRERFGRDPEGMWLPECAADVDTLRHLADCGIRFTILAPRQGRRIRPLSPGRNADQPDWLSVEGDRIDPTRLYHCELPGGQSIVLFFYDGPISQAIAFEGLLNDANTFANRMMQGFNGERTWDQLVSIATDGESYGHHHRHGEMALAYALHIIERDGLATLTNYGEFLATHEPTHEVQIWEPSSWSCVHGVERWRADCGCNSGMHDGWHQRWRKPLREAFRYLADKAEDVYTSEAGTYFRHPDHALERYIRVLLNNKLEAFREFMASEARTPDIRERQLEVMRLMEMMRVSQLLFTSCAWFFDEVSGIETVQNLKYAGRLIQLLQPFHPYLEMDFLEMLEKCPSNIPEFGNAAECYRRFVKPNIVDLERVVAHYVLTRFDVEQEEGYRRLFCYELSERDTETSSFGTTRLKLSRVNALSLIDGESMDATAVVLHFGGHDFRCSISGQLGYTTFEKLREELFTTYHKRSMTDLVRVIDEYFGRNYYSVNHLFSEGREALLRRITNVTFQRFDNTIEAIYSENRKFMDYLLEIGAPLPRSFVAAAEFVLRNRFIEELGIFMTSGGSEDLLDLAREINRLGIRFGGSEIGHPLSQAFRTLLYRLALNPSQAACDRAQALLDAFDLLRLQADHWEAQNIVFALIHRRPLPAHLQAQAGTRADHTEHSRAALERLAERLSVSLEPFEKTAPELREATRTSVERLQLPAL